MNKINLYNIFLEQSQSPEQFRDRMRKTVNDQSASYPEAEKEKNTDMWLNMWAKDFISEFTKNEISKYVPSGSYGYCKVDRIQTYEYDYDREFGGKKSLYQQLINLEKPTLNICVSNPTQSSQKWDKKFDVNGQQIGWFQLMSLDWGINDAKKLESAWNSAINLIKSNNGKYCNYTENGVQRCTKAVYVDPLEWFKNPNNILTFLEITSAFVPIIGPFLSAGFGLGNAALYYNKGDKKNAALSTFFAILPGLGSVGAKIVSKIGTKDLGILSEKLIRNGLSETEGITKQFLEKNVKNFTEKEIQTLESIVKNKEYLKSEISSIPFNDSKKLTDYLSSLKNKGVSTKVDLGINVGGVSLGLSAHPLFKKLTPGVREKIEKMGYDFEEIKSSFMSSSTSIDNQLMISALNNGWEPGQPVPEEFQTDLYRETISYFSSPINTSEYIDQDVLSDARSYIND
jgi:hypothetical protein